MAGARKGKKAARQYRPRHRKGRKGRKQVTEFAGAKQTLKLGNDPINGLFRIDDICLQQFDRLTQIGRAYQFFRINKVEMKFKPLADTFTAPGVLQPGNWMSVPYFYALINKSDSLNASITGFDGLRDAGVKPRRMDDKTITVSWRPTVALGASISETNNTMSYAAYRTSPWLSTNKNVMIPGGVSTWLPSEVPHLGIIYGVEQEYTGNDVLPYGVEITVHAQFKKPLVFSVDPNAAVAQKKEIVAR